MSLDIETDRLATLRLSLERDKRTLAALLSDSKASSSPVLVPDCSDIIEFIHIADPRVEQANPYREGIRRYFVESINLVVVPGWGYEFLEYIRRVVVENVGAFGATNGFDTFLRRYPRAAHFRQLWLAGEYAEAERVYSEKAEWTQILAFTADAFGRDLLGDPIRRFNHLCTSDRLRPVSDFMETSRWAGKDEPAFSLIRAALELRRPGPAQRIRNEVDARSIATVVALNRASDGQEFSAVSQSVAVREAFFGVIGSEQSLGYNAVAMMRSPLSSLVAHRVRAIADERVADYLTQGIELIDSLLGTMPVT